MKTKLAVHIILAAFAALVSARAASAATLFQRDTIVIRLDSLNIDEGRFRVEADTIEIRQDIPAVNLPIPESILETIPAKAPSVGKLPQVLTPEELITRGDSLHRAYDFAAAFNDYAEAYRKTSDPGAGKKAAAAQNGLNLSDFCAEPSVIARQRFSRRDFYLFYPLKNGAWRSSTNQLDSLGGPFASATYVPKNAREIYYSAPDPSGKRSIYHTRGNDTTWTAPTLLNETLTSPGNEIWPMLSPDGKTLYFASDGLNGIGGYDLFRSDWDEQLSEWSEPVNLGVPYSSPGDDFLMMQTEDGKYTIFASNRDCSRDSVYIYVLDAGKKLTRNPVKDPARLRDIASLLPVNDPSRIDNASAVSGTMPEAESTREYMKAMAKVRAMKDSLYRAEKIQDTLRINTFKDSLTTLQDQVRRIESTFLGSGVEFDPNHIQETSDRDIVGAGSAYTFTKNTPGNRLRMKFAAKTTTPDRAFTIYTGTATPAGWQFLPETAIPDGTVYQIHLLTTTAKATPANFKGITPVFEKLTPSLKYTYTAGIFRSYTDALEALTAIRPLGFPGATIITLHDRKTTQKL
jgi:hypothetical protein